jgi:hypothetical protein
MTDHSITVKSLRKRADWHRGFEDRAGAPDTDRLVLDLCADLLEMHDATGISLDTWPTAKALVEAKTGIRVQPNHA